MIDLFTRKVIGWSMSERIDSRLVVDALEMAVNRELKSAGNSGVSRRLIAHSDRGVQYASEHYQARLNQHGITLSYQLPGMVHGIRFTTLPDINHG